MELHSLTQCRAQPHLWQEVRSCRPQRTWQVGAVEEGHLARSGAEHSGVSEAAARGAGGTVAVLLIGLVPCRKSEGLLRAVSYEP